MNSTTGGNTSSGKTSSGKTSNGNSNAGNSGTSSLGQQNNSSIPAAIFKGKTMEEELSLMEDERKNAGIGYSNWVARYEYLRQALNPLVAMAHADAATGAAIPESQWGGLTSLYNSGEATPMAENIYYGKKDKHHLEDGCYTSL